LSVGEPPSILEPSDADEDLPFPFGFPTVTIGQHAREMLAAGMPTPPVQTAEVSQHLIGSAAWRREQSTKKADR
jgi:hypothetical protein